jgi:hypothetical protein
MVNIIRDFNSSFAKLLIISKEQPEICYTEVIYRLIISL